MTTKTKATLADLLAREKTLTITEVMVETNEGTYGDGDAMRATRCGDPAVNNYRVYERVGDGERRHQGCAIKRAPGRARRCGSEQMSALRRELAEVRRQIEAAR